MRLRNPVFGYIEAEGGRSVMDRFYAMTGLSCALTDVRGQVLLTGNSNSLELQSVICSKFHRQHPGSGKHCVENHVALAREAVGSLGYSLSRCGNGLIEAIVPIFNDDVHVVTFTTEPFFLSTPDIGFFRRHAEYYGYDVNAYLEAVHEVPLLVRKKVEDGMVLLNTFVKSIEKDLS